MGTNNRGKRKLIQTENCGELWSDNIPRGGHTDYCQIQIVLIAVLFVFDVLGDIDVFVDVDARVSHRGMISEYSH